MKNLFIIFFSTILFCGAGCKGNVSSVLTSTTTTVSGTSPSSTSSRAFIDYTYIQQALTSKESIKEVKLDRSFAMPNGIYKQQITNYFQIKKSNFDTVYLAIFKSGGVKENRELDPQSLERAGILYAKNDDKQWRVFFEVHNKQEIDNNNPYYVWNEGEKIFLLVADQAGAGSGEGIAKILNSDNGGKNWKIDRCFYFMPDNFFEQYQKLGFQNFLNWFKKNLSVSFEKGGLVGYYEYAYNPETGNYETKQFNKQTGKEEVVVEENCKNIILP
jgi:hypothetical protein